MAQPDTVEQLRGDLDKLLAERQGWLDEIEILRAKLTEAAAFLDRMAQTMEDYWYPRDAAECRAMAKKLRGET